MLLRIVERCTTMKRQVHRFMHTTYNQDWSTRTNHQNWIELKPNTRTHACMAHLYYIYIFFFFEKKKKTGYIVCMTRVPLQRWHTASMMMVLMTAIATKKNVEQISLTHTHNVHTHIILRQRSRWSNHWHHTQTHSFWCKWHRFSILFAICNQSHACLFAC